MTHTSAPGGPWRVGERPGARRWGSAGAVLLLAAPLLLLAGQPRGAAGEAAATPIASPTTENRRPAGVSVPRPLDGPRLEALAAFIEEAMAATRVPGAAVAVVQGGEVVFLESIGVRRLGEPAPVTSDTLFMVGSTTKPVTAVMAATVVDDGLAAWETPALELLPGFRTADPALTERLTLADLLAMGSGIPRRDEIALWNADGLTPEALVALPARVPPVARPGERFLYNSQVYSTGGYAAAAAGTDAPDLATAYRRAVRERVLAPVGMPRSTFDVSAARATGDWAAPHVVDLDGTVRPVAPELGARLLDPDAPAGALWSNGREMARLAQTLLAGGVAPDGTRVVSTANLERTWRPTTPIEGELDAAATAYGLGWFVESLGGERAVGHSGAAVGSDADLLLLPDADIGLVVLANGGDGGFFVGAIRHRFLQLLFDDPASVGPDLAGFVAVVERSRAALAADLGVLNPAALQPFLGRYTNADLGVIELRLEQGRLVLDAGEIRSELRRIGNREEGQGSYRMVDPESLGGIIELRFSERGEPEVVFVQPGVPNPDFPGYTFAREREPAATPDAAEGVDGDGGL